MNIQQVWSLVLQYALEHPDEFQEIYDHCITEAPHD